MSERKIQVRAEKLELASEIQSSEKFPELKRRGNRGDLIQDANSLDRRGKRFSQVPTVSGDSSS